MIRDLARLTDDSFDAVVVGGGVYGLATAWELASRGVRVAIVERADFASATSFNSLKTIHGGIRALQHGALGEMREFVRERRAIATVAPHLVRPLPFIVPTYRHPIRNRAVMGMFLAAYDGLASDRNAGVDPSRALPRSRTIGRDDALRFNPAIDPAGVTGGAIWHDYQLHSPERFAVALLHSAVQAGAVAANYAEARAILTHGHNITGVRIHDRLSGRELDVRARVVINAAGPGAWTLLRHAGVSPRSLPEPRFSLAMNMVVDHPPLSHACGGLVDGRFLFMVPWRDRSIVGTSHDELDETGTEGAAVKFLRDAATAFPRADITRARVRLVHRGFLPAGTGHGSLLKRSIVHDHQPDGIHGLVTVVGVRYTTARATAERTAGNVCRLLGRATMRSSTLTLPLTGGDIHNVEAYQREQSMASQLPAPLLERLIAAYGTGHVAVARLIEQNPQLGSSLSVDCRVTHAEIVHSVRDEMAVHLSDALLRRTEAGTGGHPGGAAVSAAADTMAAELSWTPAQRASEIAELDRFYELTF
jgi:glycerol-3-phosphate dehydrogenase